MCGSVRSGFVFLGLAAAGAAVALTYKISRDTGKSLVESASDVPAEATRYVNDLKVRATQAVEAGRAAAHKKQEEIDQRLQSQP